jgi:hypothetical protein
VRWKKGNGKQKEMKKRKAKAIMPRLPTRDPYGSGAVKAGGGGGALRHST